jgi:hypothetical protein
MYQETGSVALLCGVSSSGEGAAVEEGATATPYHEHRQDYEAMRLQREPSFHAWAILKTASWRSKLLLAMVHVRDAAAWGNEIWAHSGLGVTRGTIASGTTFAVYRVTTTGKALNNDEYDARELVELRISAKSLPSLVRSSHLVLEG